MLIINQQRLTAQQCDLDVRDCQSHRLSVTSLEESALAHVRSVLRPSARPQTKADVIVPSDVCAAKKRKGNIYTLKHIQTNVHVRMRIISLNHMGILHISSSFMVVGSSGSLTFEMIVKIDAKSVQYEG